MIDEGALKVDLPSGPSGPTLIRSLARFFEQVRPGDYIALLAYLTEEAAVCHRRLQGAEIQR